MKFKKTEMNWNEQKSKKNDKSNVMKRIGYKIKNVSKRIKMY